MPDRNDLAPGSPSPCSLVHPVYNTFVFYGKLKIRSFHRTV
jgi:hypothetical protein